MKRIHIGCFIFSCAVIATDLANAIVVPSGLQGEHYYLAFVTQGTMDALSNNIGDYNDFVNAQAALNSGATGTDNGIQWRVVGSTPSIDAIDNIGLDPNVPIYLMDGMTKLVDSSTQLFGCCEAGSSISLNNPLNQNQFGINVGDIQVWTGTGQDGLRNNTKIGTIPGAELGTTLIAESQSGSAGAGWIYNTTNFVTDNGNVGVPFDKPFYAISQLLSVSSPILDSSILEWRTDAVGLWNDAANWTPEGGPPVSPNQTAVFGSMTSTPTTVVANDSITVNRIEFNNAINGYVVAGHGNLTLDVNTGMVLPTIDVEAGDAQFQLDLNLNANTTVDVSTNSMLTFNNALNLLGSTLTKTGLGTVAINNKLTKDGGRVIIQQGTISGDGAISGDVINNGGIVSPGSNLLSVSAAIPEPATAILSWGAVLLMASLRIGHSMPRQR